MPDTGAGLYEVVLEQTYRSQRCLNVFHYKSNVNEDDIQAQCAAAFNADTLPDIALIQPTSVTYDTITVRNITGTLADEIIVPSTATGTLSGTGMTQFVSIPFRYNRLTKDTRDGAKRFVGVLEENALADGFEAAFFALMQTLALALDNDISNAGKTFAPVILRKPSLGAGVWRYNPITGVIALDRQTSQNSRKSF